MFDNIGSKLRMLARIICLVGILISVIAMIGIWITGGGMADRGGFTIFASGLVTGVLGALCAWGLGVMTYGFGQLVDDTEAIRHNTEDIQYHADAIRRLTEERRRSAAQKARQAAEPTE